MSNQILDKLRIMVHTARRSALNYVEFVLALILMIEGLYELKDGSQLPPNDIFVYLQSQHVETFLSLAQIFGSTAIFYGLATTNDNRAHHAMRLGTFIGFLVFTFFTFAGILSSEVNPLYWVATLGLAAIAGATYINLGWKR